jgi:hypothetical protein
MIRAMIFTYPTPLCPGDLIAVTAPSSGVAPPLHPRLDLMLAHLRSQGFRVEEGRCLRDERGDASALADAVQFSGRLIGGYLNTLVNGALATVSWSAQHGGHVAQQLS